MIRIEEQYFDSVFLFLTNRNYHKFPRVDNFFF